VTRQKAENRPANGLLTKYFQRVIIFAAIPPMFRMGCVSGDMRCARLDRIIRDIYATSGDSRTESTRFRFAAVDWQ
jgi:hypothetical protein